MMKIARHPNALNKAGTAHGLESVSREQSRQDQARNDSCDKRRRAATVGIVVRVVPTESQQSESSKPGGTGYQPFRPALAGRNDRVSATHSTSFPCDNSPIPVGGSTSRRRVARATHLWCRTSRNRKSEIATRKSVIPARMLTSSFIAAVVLLRIRRGCFCRERGYVACGAIHQRLIRATVLCLRPRKRRRQTRRRQRIASGVR